MACDRPDPDDYDQLIEYIKNKKQYEDSRGYR
jgi:hypothetical protein